MTNSLRRRTQLAAAVVAVGLLVSACASDDGSAEPSSAGPSTAPAATTPDQRPEATTPAAPTTPGDAPAPTVAPDVVPEALQFSAPLVGGGEFIGADYAGKPTVFWFWAPT